MQFDMRALPMPVRYKIVTSTITPRPIAWVTSQSPDGVVNAAPYSFFNAVGSDPPLIVLGLLKDPVERTLKDTARNIVATGEFVVNLVTEDDVDRVNDCSVAAPPDVSEVEYAGLKTLPSVTVAPPRIATSPVSFECRKIVALDVGAHQTVVLGEILIAHVQDEFVSDPRRIRFDTPAMRLLGRAQGSTFVRSTDQFELERPVYDPDRLPRR